MKKSQKAGGFGGSSNNDKKASSDKSAPNDGYCMHCRIKVTMLNSTDIEKKTKIRTIKMRVGECPKCKGKVHKIVG